MYIRFALYIGNMTERSTLKCFSFQFSSQHLFDGNYFTSHSVRRVDAPSLDSGFGGVRGGADNDGL